MYKEYIYLCAIIPIMYFIICNNIHCIMFMLWSFEFTSTITGNPRKTAQGGITGLGGQNKQKQGNQRWQLPRPAPCQCQSSFWNTLLNCYMLNVAHVTNGVKWRPIVTTFGTLIENMSRTGLYDCHILKIFVDDFMSNINCGIGVLHVKRQILTYFLWRHFSARSSFYCFIW